MKRLSNKKRKLIYIRKKNKLRLGGELSTTFKVSNEIKLYEDFPHRYIQEKLFDAANKYKMLLTLSVETKLCDDDYIKNIQTIILTLKRLEL